MLVALVRERDRATQSNHSTGAWPPETVSIEFHPPTPDGDDGRYDPDTGTVEIFRSGCMPWDVSLSAVKLAADSPCPLKELMILAHELGHHDARRFGLPFVKNGTVEEYRSEVWAWEVARSILLAGGFTDWAGFQSRSRADLATYRTGLGLSESEADEIEARIRAESPGTIIAAVQHAAAAVNPAEGTPV